MEEKPRRVCTHISLPFTPICYCRAKQRNTDEEQTGIEHTGRGGKGGRGAGGSMHLSSRRELGHEPTGPLWPKGLRGPPRPLLPLRIEVGWIRLPSANKKRHSFKLDQTTKCARGLFGGGVAEGLWIILFLGQL